MGALYSLQLSPKSEIIQHSSSHLALSGPTLPWEKPDICHEDIMETATWKETETSCQQPALSSRYVNGPPCKGIPQPQSSLLTTAALDDVLSARASSQNHPETHTPPPICDPQKVCVTINVYCFEQLFFQKNSAFVYSGHQVAPGFQGWKSRRCQYYRGQLPLSLFIKCIATLIKMSSGFFSRARQFDYKVHW